MFLLIVNLVSLIINKLTKLENDMVLLLCKVSKRRL